jgi:UDP-2,3-diacylglucosamine pyrophosphatase LpxH
MYDSIIISDLHLGSNICRVKQIQQFLSSLPPTKELIINGDLFDSLNFKRLKQNHWDILATFRKISKHTKIVWIKGNHDGSEDISHLMGSLFVNEYTIKSRDKVFLILHGDIFDRFITNHPVLTKCADYFYRAIQYIDAYFSTDFYYSTLAKNNSKTFLRCSEIICEKAKLYGSLHNVNGVICGHTHLPLVNTNGQIEYYNTGSWTDKNCSYITIKNGQVNLIVYD